MEKRILTSRDVMNLLGICENTLLKMESDGRIKVVFRISNRKRYYLENIYKSISKLKQ
jgi:predicted site-specific integrase-resolvase